MLKALIASFLVVLVATQTFPCANIPNTDISIASASANNDNVRPLIVLGDVAYTWTNPGINQTAILTIGNWTNATQNNSLILLTITGSASQYSVRIGNNQKGVIYSAIGNGDSYVFAQKDTANTNFQVQITSLTANTFGISCSMQQGNYNNMTSSACVGTCPDNGVAFAKLTNGVTLTNQFICGSFHLFLGIVLLVLSLIF